MTDRPIIFSAPMVRALLEGRKTQTRRVLKQQPYEYRGKWWVTDRVSGDCELQDWANGHVGVGLPYAPGDRLYVREHWRTARAYDDLAPSEMGGEEPVKYEADGTEQMWGWPDRFLPGRFRQGMHMPRWASRLTLTVSEVRVQRLKDITGRDILAEGVRCRGCNDVGTGDYSACRDGGCFEQRGDFIHLWNSLHGPDAWDQNPWVVALTFTVQHGNIDQIGGAA